MSLDINAFRTIAAKPDGNQLLYVQGAELKSTTVQKSGGSAQFDEFKAATKAFLDSFKAHYGSALGQTARNTLREYVEMGRPLTASVVTQLITFADKFVKDNLGSTHCVKVGDVVVDLAKLGTDKLLSTGFSQSAKRANAEKGAERAAGDIFRALAPNNAGRVDIPGLLRHIETLHAYTIRKMGAEGLRGSADEVKTFEALLFKGIDALDNKALTTVYQGLISREADALKKELSRLVSHPEADVVARAAAQRFFTDMCRMEAMILSEVSRRMGIYAGDPNAESPIARYVGEDAESANQFGGEKDMSNMNLGIMTRLASKGALEAKRIDEHTNAKLSARNMNGVDSKQIGDMIRNNELTVNCHLGAIMGWRQNGTVTDSLFKKQDAHLTNVFQTNEEQALPLDGTGYLKMRNEVEKSFFPEYAEVPIEGRDRPGYAALNTKLYKSGGADTSQGDYGRVVIVLKEHVKRECTYVLNDTFFSSTLKLKPEMCPQLEEALVAAFADRLKDPAAALAELRADNNSSPLNSFMRDDADDRVNFDAAKTLSDNIAQLLNKHLAEGAQEIDRFDVFAHLTANYANHDTNRKNVATYDNIENLLEGQNDFTAVNMAISAMKRQFDPTHRVSFMGIPYIEAQMHGPIMLSRDIEEIRIDVGEFQESAEHFFKLLTPEEKSAILNNAEFGETEYARRNHWVDGKAREIEAQVRAEVANAPCKVTFFNADEIVNDARTDSLESLKEDHFDAAGRVKPELATYIATLRGKENKADIYAAALAEAQRKLGDQPVAAKQHWGERLENAPAWFSALIDDFLNKTVANLDKLLGAPKTKEGMFNHAVNRAVLLLQRFSSVVQMLDEHGVVDAARRLEIIREALESPADEFQIKNLVNLELAADEALGDVGKLIADTLLNEVANGVPNGADLVRNAYNGMPPFAGRAFDSLVASLRLEICRAKGLIERNSMDGNVTKEQFIARLRRDIVKPAVVEKAKLLACHANWEFPSDGERNAFIAWATSAGKLRFLEELKGVYESSSLLVDVLAAKLADNDTPSVNDIIDAFKAFYPTCYSYMKLDMSNHSEYGPDDRATAVSRAVSVALSRLGSRLGNDAMQRLVAAFDSPEARALFSGLQIASGLEYEQDEETLSNGSYFQFSVFMQVFYTNLPERFGASLAKPSYGTRVPPEAIPSAVRELMRKISPEQTAALDARPYDPAIANADMRRLVRTAPAANVGAMPQDQAARKAFLLEMLPIYHNHEKTFDYGTNHHGRTHATRSFVFSIAMANILRERGVRVDMNAVALATAGHDTGRNANGPDGDASEARSADNVNAAVERLYPGAAGDAWKAQVKANITTKTENQTTIEGYLFKSADSLDYSRIDDLNEKFFPFLKTTLVTEDGVVVDEDSGLRRRLMNEALQLAKLTDPRCSRRDEVKSILKSYSDLVNAGAPQNEIREVQDRKKQVDDELGAMEKAQTDNLTDADIVNLVENAIRDNPEKFPLLTKYYLNT